MPNSGPADRNARRASTTGTVDPPKLSRHIAGGGCDVHPRPGRTDRCGARNPVVAFRAGRQFSLPQSRRPMGVVGCGCQDARISTWNSRSTTELIPSHKHPEDKPAVAEIIDQILRHGAHRSGWRCTTRPRAPSRHRAQRADLPSPMGLVADRRLAVGLPRTRIDQPAADGRPEVA
jgi:hypothetical protein